jgi:hypothetical protein
MGVLKVFIKMELSPTSLAACYHPGCSSSRR